VIDPLRDAGQRGELPGARTDRPPGVFAKLRLKVLLPVSILLLIVVWARWNDLRLHWHLAEMRRADRMLLVLSGARTMSGSDKANAIFHFLLGIRANSDWSDWYVRHEDALLRMGYLAREEVPYSNQRVPALLRMSAWSSNQIFSLRFLTASSSVVVTAPTNEIGRWKVLVADFDQRKP
jgi:hypothetical protein